MQSDIDKPWALVHVAGVTSNRQQALHSTSIRMVAVLHICKLTLRGAPACMFRPACLIAVTCSPYSHAASACKPHKPLERCQAHCMQVAHRREVGHSSPEVLQFLMHHPHLQLDLCPGRSIHCQLQRYLQVLRRTDGCLSFTSELQA